MAQSVMQFYEVLAGEYHLLFADWEREVRRQGEVLDGFIRRHVNGQASHVLDCACGIGTQAIALASRGYMVHATDFSASAVHRAMKEAVSFGVTLTFDVADFRALDARVNDTFDVVICLDNALSHLLEDADLDRAARQMRERLRPEGLLLASIRDYDRIVLEKPESGKPLIQSLPGEYEEADRERPRATMPRVFDDADGRRIAFQIWDWDAGGRSYTVNQFFMRKIEEEWRTTYYATKFRVLLRDELSHVLRAAGFSDIRWHMPEESGFYQPIVTARNSSRHDRD